MKDKVKKAKATVKRYAPVIVTTAVVTAVTVLLYTRKGDKDWNLYVLNREQLDAMIENANTTVAFKDAHVMITGKFPQE